MGCDIHLYAEIKIDDRWEHAGEIDVGRNYDLFGCMVEGHTRSSLDGVAEAKGMPPDVNPYTKILVEAYGDHTRSWLSYDECLKVNQLYKEQVEEYRDYKPFTFEHGWDYPCEVNQENFRVVFGFDS